MGKRLPNRSFIFLVIILALSITSFSIIQAIFDKPESTGPVESTQIKPTENKPLSPAPASTHSLTPAKNSKQ